MKQSYSKKLERKLKAHKKTQNPPEYNPVYLDKLAFANRHGYKTIFEMIIGLGISLNGFNQMYSREE